MYYKIEFSRGKNNYTHTVYALALEDDSDIPTFKIGLSLTDTFGGDLYWHTSSQEIVVDVNSVPLTTNPDFVWSGVSFSIPSVSPNSLKIVTSNFSFVTLYVGY